MTNLAILLTVGLTLVSIGAAEAQTRRGAQPRDGVRATSPSVAGSPAQRAGMRPAAITSRTPNASGNLGGPGTGGGGGGGP